MNPTHKIQKWANSRQDTLVVLMRALLGIVITVKGVAFLTDLNVLSALLRQSSLSRFAESFWVWYIALTSLLCGVFIILGLFTRVATILQIPVLIGAVLFINPGEHFFTLKGEFILSLIILILLVYFLFKGPGKLSIDNYLRNYEL
jgi:uncharacterized membrane protein YphA (DoxX/SURF4 family)